MTKTVAQLLRRIANRLDPQDDEPQWYALYPTTGTTATNVSGVWAWKPVGKGRP